MEVTDRELLELAAKAARTTGADIIDSEAGPQIFERYSSDGWECYRLWIPLTDDGDALRLAVNLQIDLIHFTGHLRADVRDMPDTHELYNGDPCAATRRAIVRAAASIGQSFPATSSASSS